MPRRRRCYYGGCGKSVSEHKNLVLHWFPLTVERCIKWRERCGNIDLQSLPAAELSRKYTLCSDHFPRECYVHDNSIRLLRNAMPMMKDPVSDACVKLEEQLVKLEPPEKTLEAVRSMRSAGANCGVRTQQPSPAEETVKAEPLEEVYIKVEEEEFSDEEGTAYFDCGTDPLEAAEESPEVKLESGRAEPQVTVDSSLPVVKIASDEMSLSSNVEMKVQKKVVSEKNHSCPMCDRVYGTRARMLTHLCRFHKGGASFVRELCLREFRRRKHLTKNLTTHTEKSRTCPMCDKVYTSRGRMLTHLRCFHNGSAFVCELCYKEFRRKEHLTDHLKVHLEKGRTCPMCERVYSTRGRMFIHLRCFHNRSTSFVCDLCSKEFKKREQLIRHLKIHTAQRRHHCQICPKSFARKYHLQRHSRRHTTESRSNANGQDEK